jgi:hypothetical protein
MKRIAECDANTLYLTLDRIGVNMKELDKVDPSVEYLRELYRFLLHMQLLAWKAGKSHRGIIRTVHHSLLDGKPLVSTTRRPQ